MAAKQTSAALKKTNKIEFEFEGVKYVLEFDRDSVVQTEKLFDVSVSDVVKMKMSAFDALFFGAFIKNHSDVEHETVERIQELMPDKMELLKSLAAMFAECVNTLFEEPEEGKAISWTAM
jgi:hypothetical protein